MIDELNNNSMRKKENRIFFDSILMFKQVNQRTSKSICHGKSYTIPDLRLWTLHKV